MDVPSGVASDRVVDFDIFNPPGVDSDYFAAWQSLMQPDGPVS